MLVFLENLCTQVHAACDARNLIPIFFLTLCGCGEDLSSNVPNIVLLLADDMGIGDLRVYNRQSRIPTPNLDRLAAEGIRFTDAHSPSSVCTPTRYGLLTGRYAWRTDLKEGVLAGDSPSLIEPGRRTLASLLQDHGYTTAAIGKWHLGLGQGERTDYEKPLVPGPNQLGFDYFFGIPASLDMAPYLFVENDRPVQAASGWVEASAHRREAGGGFWREGPIAPAFRHVDVLPTLTAKARAFLEERGQSPGQPFLLYVAFSAPHTPWLPTGEFRGRSRAGFYGDFCAQVDWSVGQILAQLEELHLARNTWVIFTSDNGAHWPDEDIARFNHRANLGYRGQKADIWEGGHRVPLLARWPARIPAGGQSSALFSLTDFYATIAALLGTIPGPAEGEDSLNLLHLFTGGPGLTQRETMIQHSFHGMYSVRQGDWKLILGLGSGGFTQPVQLEPQPGEPEGQLYNLREDPGEEKNLYRHRPDIVQALRRTFEKCQSRGRSAPLDG